MSVNAENHTVSAYFARAHLATATRQGLDTDALLQAAGLSEDMLGQAKTRIAPVQLANMIRLQMRMANDEFLGLSSQRSQYGVFSLLCEQLMHCATLGEVLLHTQRFYNLITEEIHLSLEVVADEQAQFMIKVPEMEQAPPSLLTELLLLIWHRFPSWLVGQTIQLDKVQLDYARPDHADEYRLLFPCPCQFDSGYSALFFDASQLQLPVVKQASMLRQYLNDVPLQWFRKQAYNDIYTAKTLALLQQSESIHQQSIEKVAARLNITSRTLRRKLTSEGSHFQQLKDNLSRDQAINLLTNPAIKIKQISQLIGFPETAGFIRAFKRWTGLAPGDYRKACIKSG
jgi:AraC-like DNA-binding protein